MTLKIKIDAVDAEVKNLDASFAALNKFAAQAQASHGRWAKLTPTISDALKTAQELRNLASQHTGEVERVNQGHSKFLSAAGSAGRVFSNLARDTKAVAGNLLRITYSFMNLGLLSTAITGLMGLGLGVAGFGLFGLENAAARLGYGRRSAMQLGANFGGYQAFGADFGRFVDPNSFLGNVFTGAYDVTSAQHLALMNAGINPNVGSTAEQAAALLAKTPQMLSGVPEGLIGAQANSLSLTSVLSLEEITRYLRASPQEREDQLKHFREDRQRFDVPPAVLEAWAKMNTQLDRAKEVMESKFGESLSKLAQPLSDLSAAFADRVAQIINSKFTKESVDALAEGITSVGKFLGSEEFRTDMTKFIAGLEQLTRVFGTVIEYVIKPAYYLGKGLWLSNRLSDPRDPYNPKTTSQFLNDVFGPSDAGGPPTPQPHRLPGPASGGGRARLLNHNRNRSATGTHDPRDVPSPYPSGMDPNNPWNTGPAAAPAGGAQPAIPVGHAPQTPGDAARAFYNVGAGQPTGDWGAGIHFNAPTEGLQPDIRQSLHRLQGIYGPFTVNYTTNGAHVAHSQHWRGEAVDIRTNGLSDAEYQRLIEDAAKAGFHRFGISTTHLHADMGNPGNQNVMTFADEGMRGMPGMTRAGRTVEEWGAYLNSIVAAQRATEARRAAIRKKFGHRGPAQHAAINVMKTLAASAHTPKRVVVQNETSLVTVTNAHVYG